MYTRTHTPDDQLRQLIRNQSKAIMTSIRWNIGNTIFNIVTLIIAIVALSKAANWNDIST